MIIGIVTGSWDLLHAGHVNLFKKARRKCDYLIAGLHVDPSVERPYKNKPIESVLERTIKLENCKWVDKVYVYEIEADLSILFKYVNADIRFLGSDSKDGRVITSERDILIEYIDSLPIHSSDLRKRMK